ncbi:MAG: pesticin C-terminus-like muramidase [Pseudomonadota bacterium]
MGTEDQNVEATVVASGATSTTTSTTASTAVSNSGVWSFLTGLFSGVVSVFSSTSAATNTTDATVSQNVEQYVDAATTVVQDKIENVVTDSVSGLVGDSVLGTVTTVVAGTITGSIVESVVDELTDSASGKITTALTDTTLGTAVLTAVDIVETLQDAETKKLGTLQPFDDADTIYAYIRQVLRHFEGNTASPCIPDIGQSSATISTGLDLGQHDATSLRSMGIDEDIIAILEPLLLQDADSAREILASQTVYLNDEQNAAVEQAIITHYMGTTAAAYDKALESQTISDEQDGVWTVDMAFVPTGFTMLPKEMQAVMVSVLFQHGSAQAVPRFWSFATQGQWENVVAELKDFYSSATVLSGRREQEAHMILLGMGRILQASQVSA